MLPLATKRYRGRLYGVLLVCIVSLLLLFRHELSLLFLPDPAVEKFYAYPLRGASLSPADGIIRVEGFAASEQGMQLAPGTRGSLTLSVTKKRGQGCLLRVWLYGDGGDERPNAIQVSVDDGISFQQVAGSGNYAGSLFDLTPYVGGSSAFHLRLEAHNRAPYATPVLERVEVLIGQSGDVRPVLPDLPRILGIVLVCLLPLVLMFSKGIRRREKATRVIFLLILLLAVYLRWSELISVSGSVIHGDARGYFRYAEEMDLFSPQGFYSAHFEKREPLYILVVKLFFSIFGVSVTHLRFVSLVFSLLTIYLTYRIGKEWIHPVVGLAAAFLLAVHPYLIDLSVRGLRAEWFSTLVLLFVYYSYVNVRLSPRVRTVVAGLLIGCILLTRSETLLMLVPVMVAYPVIARSKWNYTMAAAALLLGVILLIPHQYSVYKKHGDPFYTVNQYARFYANREFAGQPGFPTREDLATKGMYTGGKITPVEYYFALHSPWQLVRNSVLGFAKIHLSMPLYFATGKGAMGTIGYACAEVLRAESGVQVLKSGRRLLVLLQRHFLAYLVTGVLLGSLLLGVVLLAVSPYRMLFIYMFFFQVQTSFVAYLGIDNRLTVHTYPLIALCCGYAVWRVARGVQKRFGRAAVMTTFSDN